MSIVMPCFRAAPLALRSIARLQSFLSELVDTWEIIVVDDGGGDFPEDGPWRCDERVQLIRLAQNRGKGAAVRAGMLAARGASRIYTDVDLPYDLELLPIIHYFLISRGFHVVIGDRTLQGSSYAEDVGWRRRLASSVFTTFVGTLVTGGFFDTQCGLKGMRADVAEAIFPLLRVERFAFDVELLYLALLYRTDIKRIPVQLRNNETSTVRVLRDSLRSAADVMRIKYYSVMKAYESAVLRDIVSRDFRDARRAFTPNY